jgi:hypothetical protein
MCNSRTGVHLGNLPAVSEPCFARVRVRVTLQLHVHRQSVHLGAKPPGAHDQRLFFLQLNSCGHSSYVTSSLTSGWVWLLWIVSALVECRHRTYSMSLKILPFALYTSPLWAQDCKADHAYLTYLLLQRQRSHLNGRNLGRRQVWASYNFCVWLRLVQCCEHVHSHDV